MSKLPELGILHGLLTREQFCAQTGWSPRTTRRRELAGLPVIKIGKDTFYPRAEDRAWILAHQVANNTKPLDVGA
jgi:hypothetical protein